MSDSDVSVSIGGVSQPSVRQATDAAKGAIGELPDAVRQAQISASTSTMASDFNRNAQTMVKGMEGVRHASTGVRREMIVLAHEMAVGNYTRFGGSLLVMAERLNGAGIAGRALAAVMSPVGLAMVAVTAAVAGVKAR